MEKSQSKHFHVSTVGPHANSGAKCRHRRGDVWEKGCSVEMAMYRIGAFAADMLNSIDNVAKETLEEPKESSTSIRMRRKIETNSSDSLGTLEDASKIEISPSSNQSSESFVSESSPSIVDHVKGQDKDLQKTIYKKNKEIEKLNTECLELETQCESLKKEVQEAWEAYKGALEKAALRETELMDEINQIEKAKAADRQAMTQHMTTLESTHQHAATELETLRKENQELLQKMQQIDIDSKKWREEEAILREELKEAKLNSNQNLDSLREELRLSQQSIETLSKDHSSSMRQAHRRQEELERTNSELVRNLVDKDREILRLQQTQEKASMNEVYEQEINGYQRQIETLNSNYSDLKSQYESIRRKLSQSEIDHENQKKLWEKERISLIERYSTTKSFYDPSGGDIESLHEELKNKNILIQQLESQVKSLGQQLLRKQDAMQELLSERAALKVRLQDSQRRYERAEEQLASTLESESLSMYSSHKDDDEEPDLESSSSTSTMTTQYGQQIAQRKFPKNQKSKKMSSEFEKMGVKAVPSVAKAVDMIDGWTLITGRFLRHYPLLRISFVVYLVLIHLWAIVILAVHTHSLDLE